MHKLEVIISNRIEVPLSSAPKELVEEAKKKLTFDNPLYAEAKQFGRYTKGIPPKIKSYTKEGRKIFLPRGYYESLVESCKKFGIDLNCNWKTVKKKATFPDKSLKLWDYQVPWVDNLLENPTGVGVAAPGAGKTIMALEAYARLGQPCLWITHTNRLAKQAKKRAKKFLGVEAGLIGKGKFELAHFTVGMVQTLVRRDLSELRGKFGLIIIDECHHIPASTFLQVVSELDAHYLYGLTATPYREDGLEQLIFDTLGPSRAYLDKQDLRQLGKLITPEVHRVHTNFDFPYNPMSKKFGYAALHRALTENKARNQQIATDAIVEATLNDDNVCIVLVGMIDHGKELYELISEVIEDTGFVHSKMPSKAVDEVLDNFEEGKLRILIATYKMLAEGFDYQPTNRLFLTAPFKGRSLIEQACGRIERASPGKTKAIVFDYVDRKVRVLNRQAEQRLEIYSADETPVIF